MKIKGVGGVMLFSTILISISGCKKWVDLDTPSTRVSEENVYSSNYTASAVLTGIYASFSGWPFELAVTTGLTGDEMMLFDGKFNSNAEFARAFVNELQAGDRSVFTTNSYKYIYIANAALEGVSRSTMLTDKLKQQLLGEAHFIRAFFYFYLVNLYGNVPLALTTDFSTNTLLPRSDISKVYDQIIQDLKEAKSLLSENFLKSDAITPYAEGNEERLRPTSWAASALLARAYLFTGNWAEAEKEASAIISKTSLFGLIPLQEVFLKNSKESIWQLQPVGTQGATYPGYYLTLPETGADAGHPYYLSNFLLDSFEVGDKRREKWVTTVSSGGNTYSYASKYKVSEYFSPITEYETVFRLSEQYLIRSEARGRQGNLSDAIDDLNEVRKRAGLLPAEPDNEAELLSALQHERKVELFTEWGHRWLDLKRLKQIDAIMNVITPKKGNVWKSFQALFPFSLEDILRNPNLKQNEGY